MARRLGVALLAVGLLSGCGGGSTRPGATGATGGTSAAQLGLVDRLIEVRSGSGEFAAGRDRQPLAEGDGVRTDATGFGEVAYADGSVTRLDASTQLTVTKLVSRSDVHQTRIRLDRGRTWNRVTKLSNSQSSYEVETPSAVAAVRGTAFVVDCRTATCVFTVIDGTVVVTTTDGRTITLTAGQSTSVGPTTAAALTTTPAVADDPWVLKNQARDNGGSAPVPTASSTPAVQTLHIGQTATVDGDRVTVSNLTLSKTICERTGLDYMSKPPCQKGEEFFDYDPPPNTTNYHVGTRVADLEVCRGAGKPPLDLAGAFILSPYNSGTSDHSGQPASLELDNPNPLRDALKPHVQFKPDPPLAAGACRRGFTVLPTAKTPGEAIEYFDTTGPYRHGLAARWPLA